MHLYSHVNGGVRLDLSANMSSKGFAKLIVSHLKLIVCNVFFTQNKYTSINNN